MDLLLVAIYGALGFVIGNIVGWHDAHEPLGLKKARDKAIKSLAKEHERLGYLGGL